MCSTHRGADADNAAGRSHRESRGGDCYPADVLRNAGQIESRKSGHEANVATHPSYRSHRGCADRISLRHAVAPEVNLPPFFKANQAMFGPIEIWLNHGAWGEASKHYSSSQELEAWYSLHYRPRVAASLVWHLPEFHRRYGHRRRRARDRLRDAVQTPAGADGPLNRGVRDGPRGGRGTHARRRDDDLA